MAQMTMIERTGIDDGLKRGWTIPQIAKYVNRPPQTVTNEIKNRRIDSDKEFRETNLPLVRGVQTHARLQRWSLYG